MQLPDKFVERTEPILAEDWNEFVTALDRPSPISIRLNRTKIPKDLEYEKVLWSDTGFYLKARPQFTFDPLLHAGAYYVQEASSMIVEQAVKQLINGNVIILDLCAAPGGKSTLLSSLLSKDSLLVSNEIIRNRANVLAENTMKWGNSNSVITNNKPDDFKSLTHFFDLILVDAPCSGEGMFRKDQQAIREWSVDNVKLCALRQKDIITSVWDSLKPGGYLLYSTCTYNEEENENIVQWISSTLNADVVQLEIEADWGITPSSINNKNTYRFFPHKTKGEGLYFAVLQKSKDERMRNITYKQKNQKNKSIVVGYEKYLLNKEDFVLFEDKGFVNAFPTQYYYDLLHLKKYLHITHHGITLGEIKGKDFVPHQSLALSNSLNRSSFNNYEVDWKTAISFLRKEVLNLSEAPKGILLLTYKKLPLGFVKNLGNRANNLYPNEWRIRSANLPNGEVAVLSI